MIENVKVNYAEVIEEEIQKMGLHHDIRVDEDTTIFNLMVPANNTPGLNIKIFIEENGDSRYRCYLASNVVVTKRPAVTEILNKLNSKYRFICLSIDGSGTVCAAYDLALFGDRKAVCDQALATMFLYADNCDQCFPDIMCTIWNEEDKPCNACQEEKQLNDTQKEPDGSKHIV